MKCRREKRWHQASDEFAFVSSQIKIDESCPRLFNFDFTDCLPVFVHGLLGVEKEENEGEESCDE